MPLSSRTPHHLPSPLICLFTQHAPTSLTITLHSLSPHPSTQFTHIFAKKVTKYLAQANLLHANPFHCIPQFHANYTCHFIILNEIYIVAIAASNHNMILHIERALEHARVIILEVLNGSTSSNSTSQPVSSLSNVTMSNMLSLTNYAQIVFSLDELIHDTNWHHIPKRATEWIGSNVGVSMSSSGAALNMNRFLALGGRHLIMGPLIGNASSRSSHQEHESRRHQMRRRATKMRLEDTEVLNMGMNWQKESKMMRVHDERFKQLRDFDPHETPEEYTDDEYHNEQQASSAANLLTELQFDDSWRVPDADSSDAHHPMLKHQKSFDTSMNAHFGITSHQFDRLTKTSLDQLDQNAITNDMSELDLSGGVGVPTNGISVPQVSAAANLDSLYSYDRRRFSNPQPQTQPSTTVQQSSSLTRHASSPQAKNQHDSTKLNNFDLLKLDGTNTTVGSETQTFSDVEDDTSTVDSLRLSSSMSGMLSGGMTTGSPSSQHTPSPHHASTMQLPLVMNINETITSSSDGATLQAHQVYGEISVAPSEAYNASGASTEENVRFTIIFPPQIQGTTIDQFLPNTKVCRPAKNKRLTYNCSIPAAVLTKGKSIPLLRYKMATSFQPMPLKILVRRQVTKNISRILVDYALNPKLRPDMISLMIDPMPENSTVRVQKVQFKPQEQGKWNEETQQLLFKIRIDDDNIKTGKIMAQFLCDQDLESISKELEAKPLLIKYLLKKRSFLSQDSEHIMVKPLGSDRVIPLQSVMSVSEMIQGNAKV